jgi:hypothetical protein
MPNAYVLTKQTFFRANPPFAMKWRGWKLYEMFVALSLAE